MAIFTTPILIFLRIFPCFLENGKENQPPKQGFLMLVKPLQSLGKEGKSAQNSRKNPCKKKTCKKINIVLLRLPPYPLSEVSKRGGGQRGLVRGDPSYAADSGLFSAPFSYPPPLRKGTQFGGPFFGCILGPARRQPPPANPLSKLLPLALSDTSNLSRQ